MNFALTQSLASQLKQAAIPFETRGKFPPCLFVSETAWAPVAKISQQEGLRLVAEWASEEKGVFTIHAAYALGALGYALVATQLRQGVEEFSSLVPHYSVAARMERIIHDFYGLTPLGHPDLRRWIKHDSWPENAFPLRKGFALNVPLERQEGSYPFIETDGEGSYEIPVGPVHAGIIEPGHFRFQVVGEQILNLEERLGYVHKGIEKHFENQDAVSAARMAARISGDATVAHSWAYCLAAEQAVGRVVSPRAAHLRAVLCERERMANHIGDIGAICNDAAWAFMQMQCQRLREDLARLHQKLFGHRLLMDVVVPGGVTRDLDRDGTARLRNQTQAVAGEMKELFGIYEEQTSIRDRVIGSGGISAQNAQTLGLLGVVGRSAEQDLDARRDAAYSPYDQCPPQVKVCRGGDVSARLWIRFQEIQDSARLIEKLLVDLPEGSFQEPFKEPGEGSWGFAVVESWRGEIATWIRFGSGGKIQRCYVRDPSMINWLGLELAVQEVPVPDFPLNNKSFNCSYSGHDL
ncbi:MAG: hydrogenase subunit [Candidatus Nitronauta litoralis]|uniref:Hydrogenase subunit n=1 Tax=Candidatus Nitronauta litoralis TaxID=2705533 RepID=A0A7T0BW06_9BACT|nr:MAG: hydrogenase subunit [Candidatus Nitronauta litoralis]